MSDHSNIGQLTAHLFRENSGKMTAVLSRMFGLKQIDLVEDIIQDTFETALSKWRFGVPDNPSGWLMQVAKNKALNAFKRESKTRAFSPSVYLAQFDTGFENELELLLSPGEIKDSQLRLLFTCCHPRFSHKNQIIITLHVLCGFGVPEIANALLMNEEAVKKALVRTKASLRQLDHIMQASTISRADDRIRTVHTVIYLMFNEGYKTTRSKEAIDNSLCFEAIRLAKLLDTDTGTTNALLALMFFNLSRFPARLNSEHEWLTLEEQDRKKWNAVFIEEGYYYLNKATQNNEVTRFHLEAIIASLHCAAPAFEETNWEKIAYLYRKLELLEPDSSLITLNRIIAESYLPGTNSIKELDELETITGMNCNFLVSATKGDIYKRMGEWRQALQAFEQALKLAVSPTDRRFLEKKIIQIQLNTG